MTIASEQVLEKRHGGNLVVTFEICDLWNTLCISFINPVPCHQKLDEILSVSFLDMISARREISTNLQ